MLSNGKNQDIEMKAKNITVLGTSSEDYPLQKKRHRYALYSIIFAQ